MSENTLITQEGLKVLQEADNFISNLKDIKTLTVENNKQRNDAITFSNEVQKKKRTVESTRKSEKKQYDEKGKEVQRYFKPVLERLNSVKNALAVAVDKYDLKLEQEQKRRIAAEEAALEKERLSLESKAESREERADMYRKRFQELNEKAEKMKNEDSESYAATIKEMRKIRAKIQEFERKAEMDRDQAATQVAPEIPKEPPKRTGKRVTYDYEIKVVDKQRAFNIFFTMGNGANFVDINISALKKYIKATDTGGDNCTVGFPGLEIKKIRKVGVTGR